ncbi:unnamed protein product [Ectocarpus sp. 12 AP-2014]
MAARWGKILLQLALLCSSLIPAIWASDMNTLMGVKGRDFVLLGGDSAFFRSVVIMDTEYRKVVELSENVLVAASGDQGDVEVFVEWLKRNARLMQLESSRPVGARTLAHFARRNLADKLRKQGAGQAVTALLGGWNEVACQPELFWLDALGALQDVPFGAHGLASRFALSLLDNGFREGMSLHEARHLMETCFRQLERRYLVSSVGFSMKVVDKDGCRDVACIERGEEGTGGRGGGGGGGGGASEQPAGRGKPVVVPSSDSSLC